MKNTVLFLSVFVLSFSREILLGGNIDLSTVPPRDSVQLTIYNSEDLTLVREIRTVSFKKGINPLQFSWANTLIDPSSVELRFLTHAGDLEVMDTTYPHSRPQVLYWNVRSNMEGDAKAEITYFTSGITWSADYVLTSGADESLATFDGYVRITNNSGEEYENAVVRLVVGKINLVEKIRDIKFGADVYEKEVAKDAFFKRELRRAMVAAGGINASTDLVLSEACDIVKDGLSEYFIFTVPGTETIPAGWSKRLRSTHTNKAKLAVEYRYRPHEYGDRLVRIYTIKNDKDSGLGDSPLPDGLVRAFREKDGGLSYLGCESIKYVPIDGNLEVNTGSSPDMVFRSDNTHCFRDNIVMLLSGFSVYTKIGDPSLDADSKSSVAGWDEHAVYRNTIRNNSGKQATVSVRIAYDGDVAFKSRIPGVSLYDFSTVEYTINVPPDGKNLELFFEVIRGYGRNADQSGVTLVNGDPGTAF